MVRSSPRRSTRSASRSRSGASVIPRLATRGKLVLGTALLFLVVGALHAAPPLVALSGAILTVLLALYLAFYPTAILLRRKKIELSWWVPPGDQPGGRNPRREESPPARPARLRADFLERSRVPRHPGRLPRRERRFRRGHPLVANGDRIGHRRRSGRILHQRAEALSGKQTLPGSDRGRSREVILAAARPYNIEGVRLARVVRPKWRLNITRNSPSNSWSAPPPSGVP